MRLQDVHLSIFFITFAISVSIFGLQYLATIMVESDVDARILSMIVVP